MYSSTAAAAVYCGTVLLSCTAVVSETVYRLRSTFFFPRDRTHDKVVLAVRAMQEALRGDSLSLSLFVRQSDILLLISTAV